MSTLTTTSEALIPTAARAAAPTAAKAKPASARKPFWRSIYEAMVASRQRRAEQEIAAYISGHGGLLTDDMEREIMHRLTGRRSNLGN